MAHVTIDGATDYRAFNVQVGPTLVQSGASRVATLVLPPSTTAVFYDAAAAADAGDATRVFTIASGSAVAVSHTLDWPFKLGIVVETRGGGVAVSFS